MTVRELYEWAIEHKCENYELMSTEGLNSYHFTEEGLYIDKEEKIVEIS